MGGERDNIRVMLKFQAVQRSHFKVYHLKHQNKDLSWLSAVTGYVMVT